MEKSLTFLHSVFSSLPSQRVIAHISSADNTFLEISYWFGRASTDSLCRMTWLQRNLAYLKKPYTNSLL